MITIPTISQLYTSILTDLESEYGFSINPFGKSVLRAVAAVQAAKHKLIYLVIAQVQKNVWPDTSDEETLRRFGLVRLGRDIRSGVAAKYVVTVTGTVGGTIDAETTFKSDDTSLNPGHLYILDQAYTLVSSPDSITLRALDAGTVSKLNIGDTLTATQPISLVNPGATVASVDTQPLDAETVPAYRFTTLQSFRLEAQGGADTDYRIWSADAQGVAKVYPYPRAGFPCEINLFVEAVLSDSIDGKGTPTAQILSDVEDVVNFNPDTSLPINERGRRPTQVIVNYEPVTIIDVDITINGLTATAAEKLIITAALEAMIALVRPYVAGADAVADKNDILDTNKIIATIYSAKPGASFGAIDLEVNAVPLVSYTFVNGDIPYLNSVTYA